MDPKNTMKYEREFTQKKKSWDHVLYLLYNFRVLLLPVSHEYARKIPVPAILLRYLHHVWWRLEEDCRKERSGWF